MFRAAHSILPQAAICLLLVFPCIGNAGQSGDFTYEVARSAITITKYTSDGGAVTVPGTIEAMPVTSIGDRTFAGSSLQSITLPDSLESIGKAAFFQCRFLRRLTIPNRVTNIGYAAFAQSSQLAAITLPDGLTSLGDSACAGTLLLDLTLPGSLRTIPYEAFAWCLWLTNVTVHSGVERIDVHAFYECTRLTSLYFEGNAPTLGAGAFTDVYHATIYHLAGSTGWGPTFGGLPTAPWVKRPSYGQWAAGWGLPEKYPSATGEQDDADQDGLTNLREMLIGTDPTDRKSALVFSALARPADLSDEDKTPIDPAHFALYFESVPGKSYEVQSAEVLGGAWSTATTAAATKTQKRVVLNRPKAHRFYRVVIPG